MKNNNLLTYVLYAVLSLIIVAAGYYACQKQKEKKLKQEKEEAELQQTLRDMRYAPDTSATTGSSFAGEDTSHVQKPASNNVASNKNNTAQQPATAPKSTAPKTTTPAPNNGLTAKQTPTSGTAVKPLKGTPATSTSTKKTIASPSSVKGPGTGRWAVRAGTFAYVDGARRRLEEVIKAGYPNAEISKTSTGKAAVVVFRSNDKAAAIRIADQLENKGIDAAVFDRNQ